MTKVKISKSMFDQLEYDDNTKEMSSAGASAHEAKSEVEAAVASAPKPPPKRVLNPTVMIVFTNSDINAAAFHLTKSADQPFTENAIATVLVQEGAREDFIKLLQLKLRPMPPDVSLNENYKRATEIIKRLNATTVQSLSRGSKPACVCDVFHDQLGDGATGFITIHSFRTARDAMTLCLKESLDFACASIWNENYSCSYEFVVTISSSSFFFNCAHVSLKPVMPYVIDGGPYVMLDRHYHYETMEMKGTQKTVVFPIGTSFSN